MKRVFILVLCCVTGIMSSWAQGSVKGAVSNSLGEKLAGVLVLLKSNPALQSTTDANGQYVLKIPDSTTQVIRYVFFGYTTQERNLQLKDGESVTLDEVMAMATTDLNEVEVVAKALKDRDYYMEMQKKNSAATIDYVSGETMRKTGDPDIASALASVAGVSTNGGYLNVRGIGDRFIKTTINGSVIPTLDPFTNNISLDIFSTNTVDNVVLSKTASADLKADWAGAFISINTKKPSDKLTVSVESSLGFNRQTTGKKAISSAGSSTDWLGYDNSFREHDHNSFVQLVNYPIPQKTELFALGLGPYYASLGITASSAGWTETDFKLGLVQLGILKKDLFNDPAAVKAAELAYDKGPYHGKAFDVINAGAIKSNLTFPNTWNTVNRKAPPALYQSISISNQVKLFGRPLGILGGLQYSSFTQYDPHAVFYNLVNAVIINGAIRDDTVNQVISKETNSWSALFQADYQLNPNNSLSLLFMPNVSGVNTARTGISNTDLNHPLTARQQILQEYESRKQLIYQLRTEHYLPGPKAKMQLDVSYTRGNSNAPDIRSVFMPIGLAKNGNDLGGERSWQYFSDHVFDSRLSAEWPLNKAEQRLQRKMKLGLDFFRNDKRTDQYNYWIREDYDEWFTPGHSTADPFGPDVFASKPWKDGNANIHAVQKYYTYIGAPVNHNFGHSTEKAVYGLTDAELTSRLRFTGGLRIEQTLIFWDVNKYDSMKLPVDDPRRHWFDSQVLNNPVNINSVNYLPSAGLIYKLNKNEHYPFLLRLNYSQTIGKPSLREVASMNTYDFNLQSATLGNPDLKLERINNTDLRAEWYVKTGDYLSLSVFYKDFRNNIELVNFGPIYGYTWVNNDNIAWVKGIELDARKKIGAHVEIAANATWAESRSHFQKRFPSQSGGSIPLGMADHPMFGQAPYVLNALLSYTSSELGFSATCIYSVQGPRLVLDGWGDFPNVYEMPRHLLDVMISKTLSKHLTLRLKVKDLLNSPTERRYKFAEGYRLGYDKYTYGTNFIVSALYKF